MITMVKLQLSGWKKPPKNKTDTEIFNCGHNITEVRCKNKMLDQFQQYSRRMYAAMPKLNHSRSVLSIA